MTQRAAPLDLWRIAERLLQTLHALFGAPSDIADRHTVTAKTHAMFLGWLRVGEALVRQLLLIEAVALPAPAPTTQRTRKPRERRTVEFWPDKPQDWRVSFRCRLGPPASSPAAARRTQAGETPARQAKRFHSAWPIAERYEALLRAFNDPAPYAARLARRLHARPQRARAIAAAPVEFAHRVGEDDLARLTQAADAARRRFDTS